MWILCLLGAILKTISFKGSKIQSLRTTVQKPVKIANCPPKNIMLLQFPENVKSLAAPWESSCVEGNSNVAVGITFPGLHFMDGHLITNWEKEDWDAGTINKGGKFSPHPAEFRPATGLGSAGVGNGFGGGVGHHRNQIAGHIHMTIAYDHRYIQNHPFEFDKPTT